ncbi:RHTO0S04e12706g1_1 [Rhodotorula toruloides]|uniref:RHTO0S04e12706g1_1 n=1 Tax=Rhodotorula toruloides TaxID=5286 RepID=A0A061AZ42_RHOTO|nr:RHTO0S04e12706g1_1 [Rhodotorula toruloides]
MDKRLFLRNALRQNKPAVGMWLTMPGTALARTIATVPGLNWILIDGEHGLVTDRDFYELNNTISSCGVSPIIRIPYAEGWLMKRARARLGRPRLDGPNDPHRRIRPFRRLPLQVCASRDPRLWQPIHTPRVRRRCSRVRGKVQRRPPDDLADRVEGGVGEH